MIELINIDNLEFMRNCLDNQFDLSIVDPPYGIGADKAQNKAAQQRLNAKGTSKAGRHWKMYKQTNWDDAIPTKEYFDELFRISKNQIIWGGNYFTEYLPPTMGWLIWNKMQRNFSLADGEMAWSSFNKAMRIFDFSRGAALADNNNRGGRFHPTQKPVQLYKWILDKYANKGDKILDTHLGSGGIAIACHDYDFEMVGLEIDKDYYTMALRRLDDHRAQLKMF